MKISSINFNLFKTKSVTNVEQQNQNPFAINNTKTNRWLKCHRSKGNKEYDYCTD